ARLQRDAHGFMDYMHQYRRARLEIRRDSLNLDAQEAQAAALEAEGRTAEAAAARAAIAEQRRLLEERRKQLEAEADTKVQGVPEARRGDAAGIRESIDRSARGMSRAEIKSEMDASPLDRGSSFGRRTGVSADLAIASHTAIAASQVIRPTGAAFD